MFRHVRGSPSSYMTLHPIHSKFSFLFNCVPIFFLYFFLFLILFLFLFSFFVFQAGSSGPGVAARIRSLSTPRPPKYQRWASQFQGIVFLCLIVRISTVYVSVQLHRRRSCISRHNCLLVSSVRLLLSLSFCQSASI
jgi:hypothetical protein